MTDYLQAVFDMLGPAINRDNEPADWLHLEQEIGSPLPTDFKEFVARYAPAELNDRLYIHHPGSDAWNLLRWMRETVEAFDACEWEEVTAASLNPGHLVFGKGGLIPLASTNGGEYLFLLPRPGNTPLLVVHVGDDDDFYEYDMSFAEWLYRYLSDEDMTGPNSSIGWNGPAQVSKPPVWRVRC
ncbi:SMI1/KNR4 family protein [Streptomyces mauvecolor]